MTSLLLLVTALAVVVLIAVAATALLRGRRRTARRSGAAVLVLVVLYAAVLIGASVSSRPRTLRAGEWKCFDDWCVTLSSAAPTPSGQELSLAVRNAGRGRVQRPDAPHAYLELTGRAPVESTRPAWTSNWPPARKPKSLARSHGPGRDASSSPRAAGPPGS
jgi:hypothetical protein